MTKVLITPRSFGKTDPAIFAEMRKAGWEVICNPYGSILKQEQLITLLADCDGMIAGVDPIDAAVLQAAPKLRAIAKYGVGLDNIDLDYCLEQEIAVSRTIGANTEAVADFTFALMLAVARKVVLIDSRCRTGDWSKVMATDLYGKTLGLIGLGAIGKAVARRARGFSMNILAYDVFWDEIWAAENQVQKTSLDDLYEQSDFVSLHVPLLPETRQMIGAAELARFKHGAILINTARGGLVDEEALLEALDQGRLAGAGMDAFAQEPPENKTWFAMDQVVLGSHAAASTDGAANQMGRMAVANLQRDLARTGCRTMKGESR